MEQFDFSNRDKDSGNQEKRNIESQPEDDIIPLVNVNVAGPDPIGECMLKCGGIEISDGEPFPHDKVVLTLETEDASEGRSFAFSEYKNAQSAQLSAAFTIGTVIIGSIYHPPSRTEDS